MKKITLGKLLMATLLAISLPQLVAAESVFIDNMPELARDSEHPGAMIWVKPGLDRAAYPMVMIDPITIFISPDSEYKGLNADDLKSLADGFLEAFTQTLEPDVPVLNKSGPGV